MYCPKRRLAVTRPHDLLRGTADEEHNEWPGGALHVTLGSPWRRLQGPGMFGRGTVTDTPAICFDCHLCDTQGCPALIQSTPIVIQTALEPSPDLACPPVVNSSVA